MISRRTVLGSMVACGGLSACGPAAVPTATSVASVSSEIATAANAAGAAANVAFVVGYLKGILSGRPSKVTLKTADALTRGAEGIEAGAKTLAAASKPQADDSLLPLTKAQSQLSRTVVFNAPPILPGADQPEAAIWLIPMLWSGDQVFSGRSRLIGMQDLVSAPQALWEPQYEDVQIARSGVYRVGYKLVAERDDRRSMFAGGPFLHVFDDEAWNYTAILEATAGRARPDTVTTPGVEVNPFEDADMKLRMA